MLHSGSITCLYGQSVARDMLSRQPVLVAGWPRRHARGRSDASTGSTGAGNPAVWAGGGRLARAGIVPCGISRLRGHQGAGRPAGVGVPVSRRRGADIPGLHRGRAAGTSLLERGGASRLSEAPVLGLAGRDVADGAERAGWDVVAIGGLWCRAFHLLLPRLSPNPAILPVRI